MKHTKKILVFILAMMFVTACLAGCNAKSPTADKLISDGFPEKKLCVADMSLDMDFTLDMSEFIDDTGDSDMSTSLKFSGTMTSDDDTAEILGEIGATMFGMEFKQELHTWSQQVSETEVSSYEFDPEQNIWIVTTAEADNNIDLIGLDPAKIQNLSIDSNYSDKSVWSVTGKINLSDFDLGSLADMSDIGVDGSAIKLNVRLNFDRDTGVARDLYISADGFDADGGRIEKMDVSLTNIRFEDGALELPDDVKNNAVPFDNIDVSG